MQKIISNLLLIIGILLILYPFIGKEINNLNQKKIISNYKKDVYSMSIRSKTRIEESI